MWLIELIKLIVINVQLNRIARGNSDEVIDEPETVTQFSVAGNALWYIYDTHAGMPVGGAMNSSTAAYTLEQLNDNLRYELRPYSI